MDFAAGQECRIAAGLRTFLEDRCMIIEGSLLLTERQLRNTNGSGAVGKIKADGHDCSNRLMQQSESMSVEFTDGHERGLKT